MIYKKLWTTKMIDDIRKKCQDAYVEAFLHFTQMSKNIKDHKVIFH